MAPPRISDRIGGTVRRHQVPAGIPGQASRSCGREEKNRRPANRGRHSLAVPASGCLRGRPEPFMPLGTVDEAGKRARRGGGLRARASRAPTAGTVILSAPCGQQNPDSAARPEHQPFRTEAVEGRAAARSRRQTNEHGQKLVSCMRWMHGPPRLPMSRSAVAVKDGRRPEKKKQAGLLKKGRSG